MDLLLVAADHVLVVVVDVAGGRAWASAGGENVPAELSGGSEDCPDLHMKREEEYLAAL